MNIVDQKVQSVKSEFKSAGYPLPFIDNAICTFEEKILGNQNKVIHDNYYEPLLPLYFFHPTEKLQISKLHHQNIYKAKDD